MSGNFGCVNNTIRLRSGVYFDLANPDPATITIEDIACGLSRICRFGGQIRKWYSVAEHVCNCLIVAEQDGLPPAAQLAILMHDSPEAFIGDCVKPLKIMLPEYSRIEAKIEAAIAQRFGIDFAKWHAEIKEIDRAVLIAERRLLFSPDTVAWTGENQVRRVDVSAVMDTPDLAESCFMAVFNHVEKQTEVHPARGAA